MRNLIALFAVSLGLVGCQTIPPAPAVAATSAAPRDPFGPAMEYSRRAARPPLGRVSALKMSLAARCLLPSASSIKVALFLSATP